MKPYNCSRTRIPEKVQLPIDVPNLISRGPRGPEEGDDISSGILQLRGLHQRMQDSGNRARNIPECQGSWKMDATGIVGHRAH